MEISQDLLQKIYINLGIDKLEKNEQDAIIGEFGALAFQSALDRFISTLDEWSAESFERWVTSHSQDANFLEKLTTNYPAFCQILSEDIYAISQGDSAQ